MQEFFNSPTVQLVIGIAGLAMLLTVGTYIVLRFRDNSDEAESSVDLLTKFREMRHEGHIDEEEYRTIRTDLEGKLSLHSPDGDKAGKIRRGINPLDK